MAAHAESANCFHNHGHPRVMALMETDEVLHSARRESTIQSFEVFRQELDDHNDCRERLIKLNRDVTNLSKKAIFHLHRIATEEEEYETGVMISAVQRSREKFSEIRLIFDLMRIDLQGENFWRYQKAISGGVQEYIEALSFAYYLDHSTLLTYEAVQEDLLPFFPLGLPCTDYLLGVSDLTGELMRLAITSIGRQGLMSKPSLDKATTICQFVRACKSDWEVMTPYVRELRSKQDVTTDSLRKIEEAAYSVALRGFEGARLHDFGSNSQHPRDDDSIGEEVDN